MGECQVLICLPFCAKDGELAIKNLQWIRELDPKLPYQCLLSWDTETPPPMIRDMKLISESVFQKVSPNFYPAPQKRHWPAAANWAFQNAARYVAHFFPSESWLFLEADATPIRSGWLQQLEAEHIKGGKPFSGHVVDGMGHINGVAIYPSLVALFSADALRVEETAWDVVLGATVDKAMIHSANDIIRHCWNMDEKTGECTNGHGISPTFKSVHDVVRKVDLNASLYHRCKDGSLIHWLREFYKAPHKAMVPDHTGYEERAEDTSSVEGSAVHTASATASSGSGESARIVQPSDSDTEPADAVHSDEDVSGNGVVVAETAPVEVAAQSPTAPIPKTEIFIVTYWKDFPWLEWCLKCLRKHASGFQGITVALPNRDIPKWTGDKSGYRIVGYDEVEGKGMVQHMAVICMAETFMPEGTECVLHMDADCMVKESITPRDYFEGDKPIYVVRTYDSLIDAKSKVVSDCYQWRAVVEATLGMPVQIYGMCRHPTGLPVSFYKRFRKYVESKQNKPFVRYVLEQRNDFPQTFAEFPSIGAFAYKFMPQHFKWIDVSGGNNLAPKDKMRAYWSHTNRGNPTEPNFVQPEVLKEIEEFLV